MKRKTYTITELKSHATKLNGDCLSKQFDKCQSTYKWKCEKGHVWQTSWANIKGNKSKKPTWCPKCKGIGLYDVSYLIEFAKTKGGHFLSKTYTSNLRKYTWRCQNNHEFKASWANVNLKQSWCPFCSGHVIDGLKDLKEIAISRGGKLLSKNYKNATAPLSWLCVNGHKFQLSRNRVLNGRWCQQCNSFLAEEICRFHFQEIFGIKFPKTRRLSWLHLAKSDPLEIDGLSSKKIQGKFIAFEHHGMQHFREMDFFHPKKTAFIDQLRRDEVRRKRCLANGVLLVEIPELNSREGVKIGELKSFILDQLSIKGLDVERYKEKVIDLDKFHSISVLSELSEIADAKGGKLISKSYLGSSVKLQFVCSKGHKLLLKPNRVKSGTWCKRCAMTKVMSLKKKRLHSYQAVAKKFQGKLISREVINVATKVKWQCKNGHIFDATYNSVSSNHWCPFCSGHKIVEAEQRLENEIRKRGGQLVANSYKNWTTKCHIKCGKGHIFAQTPSKIFSRGQWCSQCSGNKKLSGNDIINFTKKFGLTTKNAFESRHTPIKFLCRKKHSFILSYRSLQRRISRGKNACPHCD